MSSIVDVAQKAGVSISTVSSVINKNKSVSKELTLRVEQAIEELNYYANPVARSLKSRKTNTIGVVLPNNNRIFFPQILKGIEDIALKNGYYLTFYDTESIDKEKRYIKMLENSWVDGIILDCIADVKEDSEYLEYLSKLGGKKKSIPVVSLERVLKDEITDAVIIDNKQSGYIATKHLLELGYRKLAHISGPLKFPMCIDRMQGYKRALSEYGIDIDNDMIKNGDYSPLSGYNAMKELLIHGSSSVNAVFAANDQMAIGAIRAIRETGLRIPEDIAVIGFDNIFASSIITPSLSTINVPKYRMGSTAVEILIKKIMNPEESEKEIVTLSSNLVVRQSTDLRGDNTWDLYGW